MGIIKEPKHVNFYVIDKPWTNSEKKDFSALIKKLKSQSEKAGKAQSSTSPDYPDNLSGSN